MKAYRFTLIFIASAMALLASCSRPAEAGIELTVYSHRHYEADQKLYDLFTEKTGIKIAVQKGDADQLIQRLQAEGKASKADILITADAGRLYLAREAGLLQAVDAPGLQAIPPHLRDPDKYWYGLTKRARVLAYDTQAASKPRVSTYAGLADPSLRGQIVVRSSSNVYNISLLSALIDRWGEEASTEWARGIVANLARAPQGGDRDQLKAVLAGVGSVAISNTYYIGQLMSSSDPAEREVGARIGVIFPDQDGEGVHINVSGGGVTVHSAHPKEATRLLEFLASPEAQAIFAGENFEYPVIPGVALHPYIEAWGVFKEDTRSLLILGSNSAKALAIADKTGWK
jgi:iron(III) transport system substrate-binding protein